MKNTLAGNTLIGCLACLVLLACDDGGKEPVDTSNETAIVIWVKKYHYASDIVTFSDGTLMVQTRLPAANHVFSESSRIERLLRSFKKAASRADILKRVRIVISAELFDQYRNSVGFREILRFAFDAREAMKYNFDRATAFDMANTLTVEFAHPAAANDAIEYCAKNGDYSRLFCARYR